MKKMTKLFSGVLAAAMLASVVPVSAATTNGAYVSTDKKYIPTGWEVIYNTGSVAKDSGLSSDYLRWTTDEIENNYWTTYTVAEDLVSDSGSASMLMYARDWTKDNTSNRYMEVRGKLKDTAPAGKYRLTIDLAEGKIYKGTSIWQKTSDDNKDSSHQDSTRSGFYYNVAGKTGKMDSSGVTKDTTYAKNSSSGAAWRRFTADITTAKDTDTIIFYSIKSENNLVDNVKLQAVTTDEDGNEKLGENLVVNGDFESGSSINAKNYEPTELYASNTWKYLKMLNNVTCTDEEWLSRNYAGVTSEVSRSGGKNSLFLHFEDAKQDNCYVGYQNIASQSTKFESGVSYTYELWIKGAFDDTFFVYPTGYDSANKRPSTQYTKGETDEEGWTRYYTTTTPNNTNNINFSINAQGSGTNVYIDDVKLYKTNDETKTNLLTDGGFEDNKVIDTKSLINPIAYSVKGGSAATLSWTNPENSKITDIKVKLDGSEVSGLTIDKTSGAYNCVLLSGLTDYKVYTATLEEYINGSLAYTKSIEFYTNDRNPREVIQKTAPMGGWILDKTDNNKNDDKVWKYQNSNASLDYETYHGGKSSLRFDANMPTVENNLYVAAEQKLTGLSRGNKYKLTFWAKSSGSQRLVVNESATYVDEAGTTHSNWNRIYTTTNGEEPAPNWTKFEVMLDTTAAEKNGSWKIYQSDATDTYDVSLYILTPQMVGSLWIDDVQLLACDSDGDALDDATNLITNGGFEFDGEYVAERPDFKDTNGNNLETLKGFSGDVKVTAAIKNIAAGDNFPAAIIIGLYKNSELVSCTFMDKKLSQTAENLPSDRFSDTVTVPAVEEGSDDIYSIKVMYWKGIGSMEPLTTGVTLK